VSSDTRAAGYRCIGLADRTAIDLSGVVKRRRTALHGPMLLATTSVKPSQRKPVRQSEITEISQ